jgi:phenylacetate-CoA ligase
MGATTVRLYQRIVRDVLTPLSLWRRGETAQLHYLREFEHTQFLPPEEIRDLQFVRLRALARHAYEQCPFYRRRFDRAGLRPGDLRRLDDLRALPPLEKREIQEQGDMMIAREWPRADLIPNQTGGSTGTPISFLLSGDRKCSRAAATVRHDRWAGCDVGDKTAVVWGAPRDRPADAWRTRLRDAVLREPLWLDAGLLTEERMLHFQSQLHRFRPRVVRAYARALAVFARFLQSRGLEAFHPQSIITSAEVLEDADRTLLEEVFCCPVFNRYGCREVSVIASECPQHSGLHVMAEGLYVEIETANGPAAAGEVGSVLITDLLNGAMPLIRYRIGDMAAWADGDCPCGRGLPRLTRVAGRVTDFLVGGDGRLVSGVFLATYVVAQRPSLGQVQIVQTEAGAVTYRIRPGRDFDSVSDIVYLQRATREHLGTEAEVNVEMVDALPPELSGKFLFSRSTAASRLLSPTAQG